MSNLWTGHLRRAALWAIPAVLAAGLVWSMLPHGGGEPVTPPTLPPAPAASPTGGTTAPAVPGGVSATAPDASSAAGATPQRPSSGVASGEIKLGNLVSTDEKGHMRWQILSDDMTLQQAQQTVALKNVRATFFDEDGTKMLVNGERGTYDTRTREVTVGGNVHGVTSSGRELFADTVYYSPKSRQVEGRGHVKVVQQRVIMYADSMISDLALGQTRFFGNVHMTLR
ncbi:MAG TPA: LPS export ABC transporter periplasmic protein LptC [bacterium]|nr:LPS export ABC transporter periplasmic protein LptC [bacterium]